MKSNIAFEEYMDSKITTWRTDISLELLSKLKEIHGKVIEYQKTIDQIFSLAFGSNKAGIDYSNDFDKAMTELNKYNVELIRNIEGIKKVINGTSLTQTKIM